MAIDTRIGSELGSYKIEDYIGRGGMGVVYRAEHSSLGRQVALKLLAPELAENGSFRERFVRESRLAAAIDHPNVIPIYEAGEADGVYFIAMRYVDGVDLREILHSEGPLDLDRALLVLGQVASALDAAHAANLVHRDVKPGNVLVVRGFDHCYLTDFGLTKAVASDTNFTATGQFVGTTDYVAPEQIEGRELDRRTDVYALGCVFYECLAGAPPFRRDSDMATMWAHIQEPAPRLSERRPDLPPQLDDVIATAMAKSKDDRYPSCSTFAAAARSALEIGTGRSFAALAQPEPAPVAPPPTPAPAPPPAASAAFTQPVPAGIAPPNVWQGPPEVAYVAAAPPPASDGGRSLTAVALIIAALLLAGGGTAAALIVTHKDKAAPKRVSAPVKTVIQKAKPPKLPTHKSHAPTPTPTPPVNPQPTPTPPTSAPEAPGAEKAVKDYWNTLASGDLQGAYGYLDPSQAPAEGGWIALRRKDGLNSVDFNDVAATEATPTTATVNADFETSQSSCIPQHWNGYYHLVKVGGQWLIHDHQLNHPACH